MESKKPKARAKEAAQGRPDRLSSLNDDLLVHILSYLSLREASSTSILSRRWRYLWTSTTNLDLSGCTSESFVNRILILHRGSKIRSFKVSFNCLRHNFKRDGNSDDSDSDRSSSDGGDGRAGVDDVDDVFRRYDSWLYFAVSRAVEDLSFKVELPYIQKVYKLPPCLFRSKSVRKMELSCRSLNLPRGICLPSLRCLILSGFEDLSENDIKCFTSGCPVLDSLSLLKCNFLTKMSIVVTNPSLKKLKVYDYSCHEELELEIHVPSLLSLEFSGHLRGKITVKNLVSLVELKIDLDVVHREFLNQFANQFSLLLHCIYPAKLILNSRCVDAIYESRIQHPLRASLKTTCLHLDTVLSVRLLKGITYLLNALPNLESLKLKVKSLPWSHINRTEKEKFHDGEINEIVYAEPSHYLEEAMTSGVQSIKSVEIDGILGPYYGKCEPVETYMDRYKHEIALVRIFIGNTIALEKMSIRTEMRRYGKNKNKFEILYNAMQKITSFPRASSKALIKFD